MAMVENVRQKALELHMVVSELRDETVKKCEVHFTWLEEILIEAKKSFSSPEVQLLPKTPSVKRGRQMRKNDDDGSESGAPAKRIRRTRKGKATDTDSNSGGADSTDNGSQRGSSRAGRSTRTTRATRATKGQKVELKSPVCKLGSEDYLKAGDSVSQSGTDVDKENDSPARRGIPPKMMLADSGTNSPKSPRVMNLTEATKSPAKVTANGSPKGIPGFTALNVKEKANAYEEYVSSPKKHALASTEESASPRKRNVLCRVLDSLRKSNSPHTSPRSPGKKTPGHTPSKKGSFLNKSGLTIEQASKNSPHLIKTFKSPAIDSQASKTPATPVKASEANEVDTEDKDFVAEEQHSRPMSAKRRSSRRSSVKVVSKPLGLKTPLLRRRSSIIKESLHKQSEKKLGKASSIRRTPSKSRKPTPAPVTLGHSSAEEKAQSTASSVEQEMETSPAEPRAKPRSKPRLAAQTTDTSDDEADGKTHQSPPKRTTRSKMRVNKPPPRLPVSDEDANGDADVEDEETDTQNDTPKTPTPAPRTTRSKMRLNKEAPPKLPAPSSDEDTDKTNADTPSKNNRPKARIVKPGSPSSGNKRPQGQNSNNDDPPAKKRCRDEEDADSQDSDGMVVDKTPSPPCPRSKVLRGQGNQSHTFLSQLKKTVNTPSNLSSTIHSFIKRNTPQKSTMQVRELQKRKEVEAKNKEMENRMTKRQELLQQKAEEQRRRREERQALAAKRREEQQRKIQESQRETLLKQDEKKDLKTRLLEEKQKEDREKQRAREKKLAEAEARRKQEEEARLQRLREADAEAKKLEELQQRKKEYEEGERQKRIAEQKRQEEEKRLEAEQERQREIERQRKEAEEKEKRALEERNQRVEAIKRERYEREQRELEEKKERERKRMEELDKIREKERERLKQLAAKAQQEKEAERKAKEGAGHTSALQENTSLMNASNSKAPKPNLNTTVTKEHNADSYEITPTKPKPKSNGENYDINNVESEDSTDDEDAPKKVIPAWATGANLKAALISQHYHPPNLDSIFTDIAVPDLNLLFKRKKARFNKRTSSACWDSPILKPSGSSQ